MDLENILEGENLAVYKNIQNIKVLTANAKDLITKSHAVYNDILHYHELNRPARGTDEEELSSVKSLNGECLLCGLQHGAHGFCIVQEILKAEKEKKGNPRRSVETVELVGEDVEDVSQSPKKRAKEPPRDKVKEWENLLYRKMTPKELASECERICHLYGIASGRKFLLARSMAREHEKVKPLFTHEDQHIPPKNNDNSKIASITRDCVTKTNAYLSQPCPDLHKKIASVLDSVLPCGCRSPKEGKVWKNVLKANPEIGTFGLQKTPQLDGHKKDPSMSSAVISSPVCGCVNGDCDCGSQPMCFPTEKKCLTLTDYSNNFLLTIREKLKKRRLLNSKVPPAEYHRLSLQTSSKELVLKDSEVMMEKADALHQKDLEKCIASAIGTEDVNFNKSVSELAKLTSVFTTPDDKTWGQWIDRFQTQEKIQDDEGITDDSDISTSTCSNYMSSSSSTEEEFRIPHPPVRRIPFAEEPLKLVDVLFDKIHAKFRKSIQKSSIPDLLQPYKRFFFSHVDHLMSLKGKYSIGSDVVDKLILYFRYLKGLKPRKIRTAQRLKRLEAKKKNLSKTIRRRNYIEGIQVGKNYRRCRKSMKFTRDQEYVGFTAKDRKLLQKPSSERFAISDFDEDGCGCLLSKKRIHYHYRLLRTLFNGPMQSEDKETLMDEGMKERLQKFRKELHNRSQSQFGTDSDTEGEDASALKAGSFPMQRLLKCDEKKLKSAPGYFPGGTRSNRTACTLSSRLNDYGNEPSLFNRTNSIEAKKSSLCKSSSKRIPTLNRSDQPTRAATTRTLLSEESSNKSYNRWDDYTISPSLIEESFPKASENSPRRLPPRRTDYQMLSNQTGAPTRTLFSPSNMSKESSNTRSLSKLEPFRLPTPPLSESSCGEIDFDLFQHRVPPKEEAHMEKSARAWKTTRGNHTEKNISNPRLHSHVKQTPQELDISELTDQSSDSYVPKLLKIPPKRTSTRPASSISYTHTGASYHKAVKSRARSAYLSDSSSTDTEPINSICRSSTERFAWDHKSGPSRRVAPYLDTQNYATNSKHNLPPSVTCKANYESHRTRNQKSTFTSPLPKAGPSILKKSSLPKPPSDGTSENQSKAHGLGTSPVKHQSFSDASFQTIMWPSEGLVKPARVVTERLLKATPGNPEVDVLGGSTKKLSAQSRATPDAIPSSSISGSASRKTSAALLSVSGRSKSGRTETEDESSPPQQRPSSTLKLPQLSSAIHRSAAPSTDEGTGMIADTNQVRTESIVTSSYRGVSLRSNKIASEVFRRRSLMPPDQIEKKDPQQKNKAGKKGDDLSHMRDNSATSMGAELKRLEAIGPTKRICFNLDIGQGINCVNYLKENAPGADDIKKRELVDLLVTPVEVKKPPAKKVAAKAEQESSDIAVLISQRSARESSSLTNTIPSSKHKVHDQSVKDYTPLRNTAFKTLDQIYKEVHGINGNNTPKKLLENDYQYEAKKKQQLTKHKISPLKL